VSRSSLALVAALVVAAAPAVARADDPAGSLMAAALADTDGDVGAGAMIDLGIPIENVLRIGGSLGVGSLVSTRDETNRVVMPLGVYVGVVLPLSPDLSIILRARGGIWGGATQEVKLALGGFVSGGVALGLSLGRGVSFDIGLDVWGTLGGPNLGIGAPSDAVLFAPGLGLSWGGVDDSVNPEA
jgi:hypothetical protein